LDGEVLSMSVGAGRLGLDRDGSWRKVFSSLERRSMPM